MSEQLSTQAFGMNDRLADIARQRMPGQGMGSRSTLVAPNAGRAAQDVLWDDMRGRIREYQVQRQTGLRSLGRKRNLARFMVPAGIIVVAGTAVATLAR